MIIKDLGAVSAYAYAVEKGYTGTEEEFAVLMASYATVAEEAAESAESASQSAESASASAQTATSKANEATTAAQTATAKAEETQADADAAALDASQALSAASTATTKASEAAQSASDAATAKTAAQTAQTAAEGSATTAQTAAQTATAKAAEAAESARTLTIDTTLTQSGQAADAKATGAVRDDLKTYLLDKFETVEPVNWFDSEHITTGQYIAASGTVYENSGYFCTDYIPVAEGDEILACRGNGSFAALYTYRICAYDSSKVVVPSAGRGTNTAQKYNVPSGVGYIRISFANSNLQTAVRLMIVRDGQTPTAYSAYFAPYKKLTEDFLTEASTAIMQMLDNGTFGLRNLSNKYGCAIHRRKFRKTIGIPMTWYYSSIITPKTAYMQAAVGSDRYTAYNDKIVFTDPSAPGTSVNGYTFNMYDNLLGANLRSDKDYVSAGYGFERAWVAENLSDCTLLAIGDSTVDHDAMTGTMLSHFTEQGHTLTLLGTLGDESETNKNEGRAGWKATDYLTDKQYGGVTNPFYNPSTQTFDFSYYMSNQGYTGVDFVVLQLGINDLYNSVETDTLYSTTWSAIKTMIDSILAYNSGIKIILNLPTAPNSDQSKHSAFLPLYQNRVVRYNDYAQEQARSYSTSNVRCSYCHMILDPDTEIRDNVHPTADGYAKMGMEVVNQINCWQNGV